MIGQRCVQQQIKSAIEANSLARFIILAGEKGSGRKTLAKEVASWLNADYAEVDKGVDAIRKVIENSYQISRDIIYVIDGDSLSGQAKSALLKVTEEPPNNVRFILTVSNISQTLGTLTSRACIYRMDNYTEADLNQFSGTDDWRYRNFCTNKYEIDLIKGYGIDEFYKFVQKVVDNISEVSGANALKIEEKLSFKEDDGKYDMKIFLQAFRTECVYRVQEIVDEYPDKLKYLDWAEITTDKIKKLSTPSVNKQFLFDMWIFEIRSVHYAER